MMRLFSNKKITFVLLVLINESVFYDIRIRITKKLASYEKFAIEEGSLRVQCVRIPSFFSEVRIMEGMFVQGK